jgi:predicted ester cyclase
MADNKAVIRRMFDEVVNQGKLDLIDELFDPEFESSTPQGTLNRAAFHEFVRAWRTAFPDVHTEISDLIAEGDTVAWAIRATGTHGGDFMGIPATGRKVDFDSLNIAHFRNGLGYRHKVLMDMGTLMQQLGITPAAAPA